MNVGVLREKETKGADLAKMASIFHVFCEINWLTTHEFVKTIYTSKLLRGIKDRVKSSLVESA